MSRITIDYTSAIHQGAGIGRLTRELVRAFLALDEAQQHEIRLLVMGRPGTEVPITNLMRTANLPMRTLRWNDRWLYRLWFKANVPLPVQRFSGPCDLYHAADFVLPPLDKNTPSVVTVHDLSFERDPNSAPPRLIPFLKKVVPQSAQRATHLIADSHATAQDLQTLYGIDPAKITVIHSGVESRFMPFDEESIIARRKRKYVQRHYQLGDAPFILTVGTMQRRKNHLGLVRAFAKLINRPHSASNVICLVIAGGQGWLYDDVLAEVEKLNLTDRVKFIGFVEDGDLPHLYTLASAFAFPSFYEGFGLPPLEALACGVPVVTSNVSSLPEVVGDAALTIDPNDIDALADALDKALHDDAWRAEARTRGLARAHEFTWGRAARQLLGVYGGVMRDVGR